MTTASSTSPPQTLRLDTDELAPRRFVRIGSHLVAYGGDDGAMVEVPSNRLFRRLDEDAVRAMAVSSDGTRVAVGLDSGAVLLYVYSYQRDQRSHPFVCPPTTHVQPVLSSSLLSQSDVGVRQTYADEVVWNGPCAEAPIRDLAFDDNDYLAVASEAGLVVLDTSTQQSFETLRFLQQASAEAHQHAGIKAILWSKHILASIDLQGHVAWWDCRDTKNPTQWKLIRKENEHVITRKDPGELLGADAWDRASKMIPIDNDRVALPGDVFWQLRNVTPPVEQCDLMATYHTQPMVSFGLVENEWIVSSGRDGKVILWSIRKNMEQPQVLGTFDPAPTDLHWHNGVLYILLANAQLLQITNLPLQTSTTTPEEEDSVDFTSSPQRENKSRFIDDEARSDDEDDDGSRRQQQQHNDGDDEYDSLRQKDNENNDDFQQDDEDSYRDDIPTAAYHRDIPPQPAFAPSSTPLDLSRRFLCWNQIGSILSHQHDDRRVIDIDFTDSAFKRPISFTDTMGFILGSLGEDGGVFATDLAQDNDDDDDELVNDLRISESTKALVRKSQRNSHGTDSAKGSTIYFHRYETFGSLRDKDWYLALPDGERVLGCATGEGWAAVATSRRFLRTFTSGGAQGPIVWLEGEPVTMVGRGRFLAVFYHESMPLLDGTQKIAYSLFEAGSHRLVSKGSLSSISSASYLMWAGFDNDGSLLVMDSDGMLSMLVYLGTTEGESWEWMPMLDTVGLRKSADDSYWPVTVYDGKLICVPLKGGTKHPDASRKPVTATLGLRLPMARGLAKTNALEELSVRASIALGQKKAIHDILDGTDEDEEFEQEYRTLSAQVDKVTLKMFAATIEAGKLERALDLVERLYLEKSFDLAMTIADRHRRLVDLIEDAKDRKFGGSEALTNTEDEDNEQPTSRITPDASSSRKRNFDDLPGASLADARMIRHKAALA